MTYRIPFILLYSMNIIINNSLNVTCKSCKKVGHAYYDCLEILAIRPLTDNYLDYYTQTQISNYMSDIDGKIYIRCYAGQGCFYYAKRDNINSPIQLFFMHSDMWGQYGAEASDLPKLYAFLNGYAALNNTSRLDFI